MLMTNEEICRHYRLAKDKRNDIKVLADLNQTDQASIRALLCDEGVLEPDKPIQGRKPRSRKPKLGEQIAVLYSQGKTAQEIAAELDCAVEVARKHIRAIKKAAKAAEAPAEAPASQPASQPAAA